jgi:hypothetical protein
LHEAAGNRVLVGVNEVFEARASSQACDYVAIREGQKLYGLEDKFGWDARRDQKPKAC